MIESTHELDVIRQKNETIRRYEKALRLAADMYGKSAANCGTCPMGGLFPDIVGVSCGNGKRCTSALVEYWKKAAMEYDK